MHRSIVGTGFIPLDIVVDQAEPDIQRVYAGGTCGNVLTILAFMGWDSFPVARLKRDAAEARVRRDLEKWGVKTELLSLKPVADTPLVVQRVNRSSNGQRIHRFSWTCPKCGVWLPGYRAVLQKNVPSVTKHVPKPDVFFFDRVSPAAIDLAREYRNNGAWIIFEPSATGSAALFRKALGFTHILKYSNERMNELSGLKETEAPMVQIETLGAEGLRYRLRTDRKGSAAWQHLDTFGIDAEDTAGAGDWCTAGIIHRLVEVGSPSKAGLDHQNLQDALAFGQALAAWNCQFVGARGSMYHDSVENLRSRVDRMMHRLKDETPSETTVRRKRASKMLCMSSSCKKGHKTGHSRIARQRVRIGKSS